MVGQSAHGLHHHHLAFMFLLLLHLPGWRDMVLTNGIRPSRPLLRDHTRAVGLVPEFVCPSGETRGLFDPRQPLTLCPQLPPRPSIRHCT